jgi:hypothetical protein
MLYFIIAIVLGGIIYFAVRNNGSNAANTSNIATNNDGGMYIGDAGVHDTDNQDDSNDWGTDSSDSSGDSGSDSGGGDGGGGE